MSVSHTQGFTLVETLVAITVLLLVIIGPITIAQKGIQNAYFAGERVTATFLAQEAIEGVRKLRDDQALTAWNEVGTVVDTAAWLPSCTSGCAYISETNTFGSCGSNNGCVLRLNATTGQYTHQLGAGNNSPYTRTVTIGGETAGGRPVTVDVSWSGRIFGGATQHVYLETWIYDHYQRYEND